MKSALELFTSKGFDNTSTASITKNAGVATGTLFTYFKNKEELINELYLSTKKEAMELFLPLFEMKKLSEETVNRIWFNSINWGLSYPCKLKFIQQYSTSPYITKLPNEDDEDSKWEDLFQNSKDSQIVKDLPIDFLIEAFVSHIYFTIRYMIKNDIRDEELVNALFPTLWDMIRNVK